MIGRKKSYGILLVLLLAIVIGCAKQESSAHLFESDYIQMVSYEPTRVREGEFRVKDGISYYVDYETMVAVPICNKPDCRHLPQFLNPGTTCNAALEYQRIFPYAGLLYGLKMIDMEEIELFISGFDGSNRRSIGSFPGGPGVRDFVLVGSKLYYNTFILSEEIIMESGSNLLLAWSIYVLDLNTLEIEEIITVKGVNYNIYLLGGTKEYQIFQIGDDAGIGYYALDYATNQSERLPIEGQGYQPIIPEKEKSFYYISVSDDGGSSIHSYDLTKKEDRTCISEEEINNLVEDTVNSVSLHTTYEQGFTFGVYGFDQLNSPIFIKEDRDDPIKKLILPEQLEENHNTYFNSFISETKEGMFFEYQRQVEIAEDEIDCITWYGYIKKNALLNGIDKVKVIMKPKISNLANPVDNEGNILY